MATTAWTCAIVCLCSVLCTVQGALWRKPVRTGQINGVYNYETRYFTQKLDHFSFATADVTTFQQRYLINVDSYEPGGPLFFYCGNEGDITWFCNNTGFMWEIAPDFKAMIVFAEHRYYGESLPFGKDSFSDLAHLGYLTSEQALADFDVLISSLREEYDSNLQVVAFGGSYGGMLSAWLRMKYPGAVVGAIAASAPIWQFPNLTDCELPYRVISDTLNQYSPICSSNVLQSWKAIYTIASGTDGLSWLSNAFFLCDPLAEPVLLINWLEGVWFNMAMCNYPYPSDFLEPLPAWPLKVTCQYISETFGDDKQLLEGLSKAMQVYYNYTGQNSCLDLSKDSRAALGNKGWSFQACTEMVMPMCSDGVNDVFPVQQWNFTEVVDDCKRNYWGVEPDPNWIVRLYNGKNLTGVANIVFSNGKLDPWSNGGVLESISDSVISVVIKDGAHHLDLRASNPADPESVIQARAIHRANILKWLERPQDSTPFHHETIL